jgi:uncharacterized protein YndB with AHSA1/START domain
MHKVFGLLVSMIVFVAMSSSSWAQERAIDKEVVINATLEQAWASWTTRDGIRSFFAPDAVIEPRPGGAFHIHIDPGAADGMKGADTMRYLALQPMKMLSFDWNAPPHLPEARAQRTSVTLRFEALDDKRTRIRLHHTGWGDGGEWDKAFTYFDRAWGSVLGNLKTRWDSGKPMDWTEWLARLEAMRKAAGK